MAGKEVGHHSESLNDVHPCGYLSGGPPSHSSLLKTRASGCDPVNEAVPWSPPANASLKAKQGMKWTSSNVHYAAKSYHPFPTPDFHD